MPAFPPQSPAETIGVVGLGYVGLPVAIAFSRKFPTVGFDVSEKRIAALRRGHDSTGEVGEEELHRAQLEITDDPAALRRASFFIVAVPTPIDRDRRPDLGPVLSASEIVGRALSPGAVVCYESTVYPGVTEELCVPVLERCSGLEAGADFALAYSPERINPGDREHGFEGLTKVVAGQDEATLERVASTYEQVIKADVYRAPSIKVAEAAKVIENIQRDLNIALMNEFAFIFDRIGIRTRDVLDAAGTKWNFLPFTPGLVGGHCIGVDPYYLTTKAEELGYHPQVILSGRRINDSVGAYIAQRAMKMLSRSGVSLKRAKVAVLGLTFKEDVPDVRNSRVVDIVRELREYGIEPRIHDPLADAEEARRECGVELSPWEEIGYELDALVLAVPHRCYTEQSTDRLLSRVRDGGVVVDVKSMLDPNSLDCRFQYWSL